MSDQVRISSIDALEAFRADLVQYIAKARVALEDMEGDVRRTQTWLDTDRVQHWGSQIKQWTKKLDQAEQELYSANLTSPHSANAFQKMAVLKAKRNLEEAERKMALVKKWRQTFENRATPLLRQLDPMFFIVGQQLPKGVYSLGESIKALQAYADKMPASTSPPPVTAEPGGEP
ncbi:MAG: hypothetical protein ABI600_02090 [Luteolibacter sp.]